MSVADLHIRISARDIDDALVDALARVVPFYHPHITAGLAFVRLITIWVHHSPSHKPSGHGHSPEKGGLPLKRKHKHR